MVSPPTEAFNLDTITLQLSTVSTISQYREINKKKWFKMKHIQTQIEKTRSVHIDYC